MNTSLKLSIEALRHEDYMSDSQKAVFAQFLQSESDRLIARQNDMLNQLKSSNNDGADDADAAFNIENQKSLQKEVAKTRLDIQRVNLSLNAILTDDYGYCIGCGSEIGLDRMIAQPIAVRDIDCSTIFELKNKTQFNGKLKIA